METKYPYPVKSYIAFRHDPLMGYPDPDRLKQIFDNLDLLVSITFTWRETAWYADVVLPISPYLERESLIEDFADKGMVYLTDKPIYQRGKGHDRRRVAIARCSAVEWSFFVVERYQFFCVTIPFF